MREKSSNCLQTLWHMQQKKDSRKAVSVEETVSIMLT
jgi:hypothetical protein